MILYVYRFLSTRFLCQQSTNIRFRAEAYFRQNSKQKNFALITQKSVYNGEYWSNDGKIGLFILIMAYFITKRQFCYEICWNEKCSNAHIRLKMNSFLGLLRPILKKVISGTVSRSIKKSLDSIGHQIGHKSDVLICSFETLWKKSNCQEMGNQEARRSRRILSTPSNLSSTYFDEKERGASKSTR